MTWGIVGVLFVVLFVRRIWRVCGVGAVRRVGEFPRRDRVEFDRFVALEIVQGVAAADAPFLDGASRTVVLLGALFCPAQTFGRGGRTEVRAAIAAPWSGRRAAGPSESWRTKTAAEGARAEPATRARSTESSAGRSRTEAAWRPVLPSSRLADCEAATLEGLGVEALDDFFRGRTFREFYEREATWPTGFAINRHDDMGGLSDGGEVDAEIRFTRSIREIPDKQTD
jgi:hypothetical protein